MIAAAPSPPRLAAHVKEVAKDLESYKLLRYFVLTLKFHRKPIADYLKEESGTRGSGSVSYDEIEPWTRVSPQDYERNIREMIRLARAGGARVVLLDNELWPGKPVSSGPESESRPTRRRRSSTA